MTTEPQLPPTTPADTKAFYIGMAIWSAMLIGPAILFRWQEKVDQERAKQDAAKGAKPGFSR